MLVTIYCLDLNNSPTIYCCLSYKLFIIFFIPHFLTGHVKLDSLMYKTILISYNRVSLIASNTLSLFLFQGCQGLQVEEIWSMDKQSFMNLEPIHGLIFLFKWIDDLEPTGTVVKDERLDKIFFARQVINNACATQAILSILLNCKHEDIKLGDTLTNFKEFCHSFDSYNKGLALSNAAEIRAVHNSFARQSMYDIEMKSDIKDEDIYHFISYIPIDGRLYELDGLKQGPIDLGPIPENMTWTEAMKPIIENRMQRYNDGEIHFNLMAVISDRQKLYQKQIDILLNPTTNTMGGVDEEVETEIAKLRSLIECEIEKRKRYRIENIRRKHNFLPFIIELFKLLGQRGQLVPIYENAKKRVLERESKMDASIALDAATAISRSTKITKDGNVQMEKKS